MMNSIKKTSKIKKEFLRNFRIIYVLCFLFGLILVSRLFYIQIFKSNKNQKRDIKYEYVGNVEFRGSVLSNKMKVLAMSIPKYTVSMDMKCYQNEDVDSKIKTLSGQLAGFLGDKTESQYLDYLMTGRQKGNRYLKLITQPISIDSIKQMKEFEFFKLKRNIGGVIIENKYQRVLPYKRLAHSVIGDKTNSFGIEKGYNKLLINQNLKLLKEKYVVGYFNDRRQKKFNEMWLLSTDVLRRNNKGIQDVVSTLDMDIQSIAHNALKSQLIKSNAKFGAAIVMEVNTGAIRAMVNLSKLQEGRYKEIQDYSITSRFEPGSTMKLITYLIGLELGLIDLDEQIDTGQEGVFAFEKQFIRESVNKGFGSISVKEGFEKSSNILISKLMIDKFNTAALEQEFFAWLKKLGLNKKLGYAIPNEIEPSFKEYKSSTWSKYSKIWLAFGYEYALTPLQLLTLYNAVANNGVMVKPQFVQATSYLNKPFKKVQTENLISTICSPETLFQLKKLLRGVVKNGTAKNIDRKDLSLAGKTGTAVVYQQARGYGEKGSRKYRGSFCGFFPFEKPKYSMFILVGEPSKGGYYGSTVAAPVFKEIALKIKNLYPNQFEKNLLLPNQSIMTDSRNIQYLESLFSEKKENIVQKENISTAINQFAPNVLGKDLKTALNILAGLDVEVKVRGSAGRVYKQNYRNGERLRSNKPFIVNLRL